MSSKVAQPSRPFVSVVVVGYNQGRYIGDAISSVFAQTYGAKEIIVVDDGSTDDTAEIVARYSDIQYLKQSNQGLSAARNAGLAASRGDYVVFLDADDRLLPCALEAGVNCFLAFPESAFVFGQYRTIDASGNPEPVQRELGTIDNYYLQLLHGNFIGMHAAVMYSKESLGKAGGFNTELRAAEDYDLYLRLARDREIKQHGWLVAEYRRHERNITGDAALMLRAVLRVCDIERARIRNPQQAESLRAGKTFYTNYYGNKMIDAWKRQRDPYGLFQLLRWYPTGLFRRVGRSLINRVTPVRDASLINFGSLRRLSPVSRQFGYERGQPIDRRYINFFLSGYAADIRGVVLEIGDDSYCRRFGGNRISKQEILHVSNANSNATIVANLEHAPQIPSGSFDCIVFTQTLHLIYDPKAALVTLHRILKNDGTLLMSVPGISQICHDASCSNSDSWRFTKYSISRLVAEVFVDGGVKVQAYGNVLAASSFLYGIAAQELTSEELDFCDDDYPIVICARARKGRGPQ